MAYIREGGRLFCIMQNMSLDWAFSFSVKSIPVNPDKLGVCIKFVFNASSRASPATYRFAPKPHYCVQFIYLGDSREAYVCSRFDQ